MKFGILLSILLVSPSLLLAQGRNEPKAEDVRAAIDKAVKLLKSKQDRNGTWEGTSGLPGLLGNNDGGISALVMLALLESGVEPKDPVMKKGLQYMSNLNSRSTYVVSLQTMVLSLADPRQYGPKIKDNIDWLMKIAAPDDPKGELAWGYPIGGGRGLDRPDHSNTQYAVLALFAAESAGVNLEMDVWKKVQQFYVRTQHKNSGGWSYPIHSPGAERLTMTSAGVCGMLLTDMMMSRKNSKPLNPDDKGDFTECSTVVADKHLEIGLKYIADHFSVSTGARGGDFNQVGFYFYNLYGIERAGRLSGLRFFTRSDNVLIDWYRAGVRELMKNQQQNGGWANMSSLMDGSETIATSFSLLFLAKGKTPVLIHKLAHGSLPRGYCSDWNLNRNDIRNLTEFCSKNLFKKNERPVPLTWQIFDISRQAIGQAPNPDVIVADLLQAPILFITGSQGLRLTNGEKSMLKKYIEQGGFIFVEAACGKLKFDEAFRDLCKELWPDRQLTPLPPGHAIWNAYYPIPEGTFELHGLDVGCKTSLVYCPKGISSHWERNDILSERGKLSFQVAGNVIAYATGLEPPEDKLTPKTLVKTEESPLQRNFLEVAQINYGGKNWQPAPNAMRVVMNAATKKGLDVILQTKAISINDADLPLQKFMYMHGRGSFSWDKEQMKRFRENLEEGSLLLCDACCADAAFDKAFRSTVKEMCGRDLIPIPLDDPLYSARIGGKELRQVKGRIRPGASYETMDVVLEGIRRDPKDDKSPWMIVYSKIDIGCALDKHASAECAGYDHESALAIALQVLQYALKE